VTWKLGEQEGFYFLAVGLKAQGTVPCICSWMCLLRIYACPVFYFWVERIVLNVEVMPFFPPSHHHTGSFMQLMNCVKRKSVCVCVCVCVFTTCIYPLHRKNLKYLLHSFAPCSALKSHTKG
jgi:hypothetical protein